MGTNVEQLREKLIAVYPASKSWKAKVRKMQENQVYALYYKFKRLGHIKS